MVVVALVFVAHNSHLICFRFNDDSFDPDFLEHGWLDTIAMERLTKSPFVMTIYGNCGFSQILELGEFSFHDYVKHARQQGEKTTPSDRLKIGFQLASGIADMHSIDGDRPSLAHNDIDGGQIILVDGVFKLSDFHLASIKYEDQEGEVCHERPKNLSNHVSIVFRVTIMLLSNIIMI
jgi:serine/threonine protein kinase